MTNEQLSILLSNIVDQLQDAMSLAEEELEGLDIPRNTEEHYVGKMLFGPVVNKNHNDYKVIETTPLALNKLKSVIEGIKSQSITLSGSILTGVKS